MAFAAGTTLILVAGLTATGTTAAIEAIDTAKGSVSRMGRLAVAVHDAGVAVLGQSAYVIGGGAVVAGATVQRVTAAGVASIVGRLPAPRADLAAVALDGLIVVIGGGTPSGADARILESADGRRYRVASKLAVGVRYPAVIASGGKVFVFGGSDGVHDVAAIQEFDPVSGVARIIGRLPNPLSHAAALVVGGRILIAGGRNGGRAQDGLWSFDPVSGRVSAVGTLPHPVSDAAVAVVAGVGYLIGGEAADPLATIVTIRPGM